VLPVRGEFATCAELCAAAAGLLPASNQAIKVSLGLSVKAEVKTLTEGSHT